jgi:two-component system, OmpR family, response regulator
MTATTQPTKSANLRAKTRQTHEKLVESAPPKTDQRVKGMRVLLIEDDQNAAEFILKGLAEHGYVADHATEGKDGLFLAASAKYDCMIIDRMLPGLDGLSIVKMLRATGNQVPAIFLTTMAGIDDRVQGLDAGADDYLVKPFAFSELLARISALLRRPPISETKTVLRTADLEMDLLKRTVRRAGRTIDLQPQEFRLLEYLMRSEGRVVTRTMLLENVWDFHFDPQTSVVETHISRLRAKIDKGFDSELVRTIRGVGYCLREDV